MQFEIKSIFISVVLRQIHEYWATKYGEIFRIFIGSKIYLIVSSPELIEVKEIIWDDVTKI